MVAVILAATRLIQDLQTKQVLKHRLTKRQYGHQTRPHTFGDHYRCAFVDALPYIFEECSRKGT